MITGPDTFLILDEFEEIEDLPLSAEIQANNISHKFFDFNEIALSQETIVLKGHFDSYTGFENKISVKKEETDIERLISGEQGTLRSDLGENSQSLFKFGDKDIYSIFGGKIPALISFEMENSRIIATNSFEFPINLKIDENCGINFIKESKFKHIRNNSFFILGGFNQVQKRIGGRQTISKRVLKDCSVFCLENGKIMEISDMITNRANFSPIVWKVIFLELMSFRIMYMRLEEKVIFLIRANVKNSILIQTNGPRLQILTSEGKITKFSV